MKTRHDQDERIEQYLFDRLSRDEQLAFEKEMQQDEGLRQAVMLRMQIANAFQRKAEQPVLDALRNIESEDALRAILLDTERKLQQSKTKVRRLVLACVSAAAIVLCVLYLGLQPRHSSEHLYAAYYASEHYEPLPERGDAPSVEEQELYRLVCLIETDASAALTGLKVLHSSAEADLKESVDWNIALAYLKLNKRKEACAVLKEIIDKKGFYQEKARNLLSEIQEKRWF